MVNVMVCLFGNVDRTKRKESLKQAAIRAWRRKRGMAEVESNRFRIQEFFIFGNGEGEIDVLNDSVTQTRAVSVFALNAKSLCDTQKLRIANLIVISKHHGKTNQPYTITRVSTWVPHVIANGTTRIPSHVKNDCSVTVSTWNSCIECGAHSLQEVRYIDNSGRCNVPWEKTDNGFDVLSKRLSNREARTYSSCGGKVIVEGESWS